jgi:C2 domain
MDIEDRYYGSPFITQSFMLENSKNYIDAQIEGVQDINKRNWLNKIKKRIKTEQIRLKDVKYLASVEYRPLSIKGKKTAQGMLEMFVEVLDSNTSKLVPISKIAKPLPEKYELRLIIWKCENIPKREDKTTNDIFFKVQFDPNGWLEQALEKETDCHTGSEDGHGIFNWRMKFQFELPCSFARIRIVAYDFSTFGDDVVSSEVVLDLSKHFRRVMKEGKLAQEEQWVQLLVPGANKPGGRVLTSFNILSLAEADQNPVGEGQDDPNRDPELEKPEEGRGIGDFLKGTALDVSKWSLFNFGLIKKLLVLMSMLGTIVVLFMYPGLISKPN